ncbi:11728_t:CDS:1 [Acaulospora morrowiae]|uniref:11728_t:CDS:1 n=1 Tax=Acaulospora morrowiae TaxID=94023 RepID=A0A9N9AQY0_9GLOM|nr:11728_t:CDS:1 [Acaulospora morrowiae]
MVFKSKKKADPSVYKSLSIITLPTEILLMTFSHLEFPSLFCLSNVCKRFQMIGERCMAEKFKKSNVALSLSFEQEHRWNYGVQFFLDHVDLKNGRFVFKPRISNVMKFIRSPMIQKPTICKIQIIRVDEENNINASSITVDNAANRNGTMVRNNNAPNMTAARGNQRLPENFVRNPCAISIKQTNATVEKIVKIYRIGHGTTHLKSSFRFTYSITDKPPPLENADRGGERWIKPEKFECYASFFYPHEPTAHKIMMNLIELKNRNGGANKKIKKSKDINSIKKNHKGKIADCSDDFIIVNKGKDVVHYANSSNKGKNVIRSEENLLEIELDMDGQEVSRREGNMNSMDLSYLLEMQEMQEIQEQQRQEYSMMIRKLIGPIRSSTRWIRGARR